MKTYEEMAQSVIRRAKIHRTIRNRCIFGVTAAVCALGICLGVMAAKEPTGNLPSSLQPPVVTDPNRTATDPTVPQAEPRVTLLYNDGTDTTEMQEDIAYPYQMEIRIQDISGLTKEEAAAVCEAEEKYARELVASYADATDNYKTNGYQWAQFSGRNVVMTSISAGHFILGVEDPKLVERVYVSVEGTVQLAYLPPANDEKFGTPTEYDLNATEVRSHYAESYGGLAFGWMFSSELFYEEYAPNPVPLSSFHDTISITVTFKDGSVEHHAIDLVFNDSGEVYAIYQGQTTAI